MKTKDVLPKLRTHLASGRKITSNQALRLFGTSRLASYILRLRKERRLNSETETVKDKSGDTFGRYFVKI